MAIANALIGTTNTTLLTVPAGKQYAITTLMVCNNGNYDSGGANDCAFDLHIVPDGQAIGNSNIVVNNLNVAGADTFTFDTEKIIVDENDTVVLVAQIANRLTATLSYLEV